MLKLFVIIELLFIVTLGYSHAPRKVKGEILDADGIPIPGLVVIQLGTTTETLTNVDGQFELTVNNDQIIYLKAYGLEISM